MKNRTVPAADHVVAVVPFPSLSAQLQTAGYEPGFPAHVPPAVRRIDTAMCQEMLCGHCGAAGLEARPFHRGAEYALASYCPLCGFEEAS